MSKVLISVRAHMHSLNVPKTMEWHFPCQYHFSSHLEMEN